MKEFLGAAEGAYHNMWALLALLVCLPGALGASRFHERNHTGLLFLYTFDEGQASPTPPEHTRDVTGRYLMGNLSTSTTGAIDWSASRQGIAIPSIGGGMRAASSETSASALSLLTDEFTLEFFISSPLNPLTQSLLIAGFGDWPPGAPFSACNLSSSATEGGWRLYSDWGDLILFSGVMSVSGVPTCITIGSPLAVDVLRHVVVRGRNGSPSMVSDMGTSSDVTSGMKFDPALWAQYPAPLTIASPHAKNGWTGNLYMVAMYDRYLSNVEIAANRDFGPPNSFPYGAGAVSIDEDVPATLVSM